MQTVGAPNPQVVLGSTVFEWEASSYLSRAVDLKCGSQARSISIIWELPRHANSGAPLALLNQKLLLGLSNTPSGSFCVASCCLAAKSCPTLCDLTDCSPPGSFVHGISQAGILEWVAISFSRGSSQLRDQTRVSCIAGGFFTTEPTMVAHDASEEP